MPLSEPGATEPYRTLPHADLAVGHDQPIRNLDRALPPHDRGRRASGYVANEKGRLTSRPFLSRSRSGRLAGHIDPVGHKTRIGLDFRIGMGVLPPHDVNVTRHPTAVWVWRQLINATHWGSAPRFLIRDRDRSCGGDSVARAPAIGIRTVLTPIATPQANAVAERLVGTFRRECLDQIIVMNERHLRCVLHEFIRHYNSARPHRTLELEVPKPTLVSVPEAGPVVGRRVIGGLTHEYERAA